MNILLIVKRFEDIKLYRGLLNDGLKNIEYNLTVADNLSKAIESIKRNVFDLVLLELNLPDSEGIISLHELNKEIPNIPIIALKENKYAESQINIIRAGAQDCLLKEIINSEVLAKSIHLSLERKKIEESIIQLERLYNFLGKINQCIINSYSQEELFQRICDIAVKFGGFQMSFVGLFNKETKHVTPVAMKGVNEYFYKYLGKNFDELEHDPGASLRAVQKKGIYYCNNILNSDEWSFWHLIAKKIGINSTASIPFKFQGEIIGAFSVFSDENNYFNDSAVELMNEVGMLISNALNNIERDKENKESLASLKKSEERYRFLTENSPVGIFMLDASRKCFYVNERWCRITGLTKEDAFDDKWIQCVNRDDTEKVIDKWESAISEQTVSRAEYRFIRPDGKTIWLDCQISAEKGSSGETTGYIGTITDITERKFAEEKMQKSEIKYRTLAENLPAVIAQYDIDMRYAYVNPAIEQVTGKSAEEIIGKTNEELGMPKENVIIWNAALQEVFKTAKPQTIEFDFNSPSGERNFSALVVPEFDEKGNVKTILTVSFDITERKNTEKSLQESTIRYKELFNKTYNCIAVYEAIDDGEDFLFLDINPTTERIEKVKREDIIGKRVTEIFPGIGEFKLLDIFKNVWKTGIPEHQPVSLYKDERVSSWKENYVYKLPSGEIVAIYEDISERKKAEQAYFEKSEELNRFFNLTLDLLCIADLNGYFIHLNPSWELVLGYKIEELEGKSFLGFCPSR